MKFGLLAYWPCVRPRVNVARTVATAFRFQDVCLPENISILVSIRLKKVF